MEQATSAHKRELPELQQMRGFIITEETEFALKDVANGLDAVAMLTEERSGDTPEIPPENWAGLLRVFSRQVQGALDSAGFANNAMARPRELH